MYTPAAQIAENVHLIPRILDQFEKSPVTLEVIRNQAAAEYKPLASLVHKAYESVRKLNWSLFGKYPDVQIRAIKAIYHGYIDQLVSAAAINQAPSAKAILALFSLVGERLEVTDIKALAGLMNTLEGEQGEFLNQYKNSFLILQDVFSEKSKIRDFADSLKEMRENSVKIAALFAAGDESIHGQSCEDLLATLPLNRMYNVLYWYTYG